MQANRISLAVEEQAKNNGNRICWITEQKETSYLEFFAEVQRLAQNLLTSGVESGDRVGLWMSNRIEFTIAEMAVNYIGAVGVPISTRYKAHEMGYIVRHAGVKTLFMMDSLTGIDFLNIIEEVAPGFGHYSRDKLPCSDLPSLETVVCLNTVGGERPDSVWDWDEFMNMDPYPHGENPVETGTAAVDPTELSYIQYTSGSTGVPKGVMHNHSQVFLSLTVLGERWELTPDDRLLIVAPFFHGLGHMCGPPMGLIVGSAIVPLEIFDAGKALEYIERFKCTTISAPPTMFQMMLEHPKLNLIDASTLRGALITAAPAPEGLKTELIRKFPFTRFITGYGSSESCGGTTQSKIGDPPDLVEETIGFPLRSYEVRVVDPETGVQVPPHKHGELVVSGPCIMLGYYGEAQKSAEVIDPDGWLHTGDLAQYDDNGYLKIVGRIKDLIITGGNNVYPAEVESMLLQHASVKEAQVVGVPDQLLGEVVMAFVIASEESAVAAEELQAFCKERLSSYKAPRHIKFVESFPISGTGKVLKKELKKWAAEEVG